MSYYGRATKARCGPALGHPMCLMVLEQQGNNEKVWTYNNRPCARIRYVGKSQSCMVSLGVGGYSDNEDNREGQRQHEEPEEEEKGRRYALRPQALRILQQLRTKWPRWRGASRLVLLGTGPSPAWTKALLQQLQLSSGDGTNHIHKSMHD